MQNNLRKNTKFELECRSKVLLFEGLGGRSQGGNNFDFYSSLNLLSLQPFHAADLGICAEGFKIRVNFSMTLDSMKDIQSEKLARLICIQSLKPGSYCISREIIKNVKWSTNAQTSKCSEIVRVTKISYSNTFQKIMGRFRQLAHVMFVRTPIFIGVCMILDMRTLTGTLISSLWFFKVLEIFQILKILYCFETYCYMFLFVCPWRQILYCLHLF